MLRPAACGVILIERVRPRQSIWQLPGVPIARICILYVRVAGRLRVDEVRRGQGSILFWCWVLHIDYSCPLIRIFSTLSQRKIVEGRNV